MAKVIVGGEMQFGGYVEINFRDFGGLGSQVGSDGFILVEDGFCMVAFEDDAIFDGWLGFRLGEYGNS